MKRKILSLVLLFALSGGIIPYAQAAEEIKVTPTDKEFIALLPQSPGPIPEIENPSTLFPYGWSEGKSCEEVYGEIVTLTNKLTSGANDETSRARTIYQWVASNISYDDMAFSYQEQQRLGKSLSEAEYKRVEQAADPIYTFNNGRGVCGGYAQLSMLMLTIAGLPSAHISGFEQGTTEQKMEDGEGRHAWNAVYADGRWIWFDATWGKWDMSSSFHKKIDGIYWYAGVLSGWPEYKNINEKVFEGDLVIPKTGKEITGNTYQISSLFNPTAPTIPSYVERLSIVQNQQIEKLHLSNALTEVDVSKCPALTEIVISGTLSKLNIADCSCLITLTMPNTLTKLGIYNCPGLTELIVPDSVTELVAIQNCGGLKRVVLGRGLKEIYAHTFFNNASLTEVQFGEGLENIGYNAFGNCSALEQLRLPNSLKSIGECAFENCTGLMQVVFPEGIETISADAFTGCKGLTSIVFPQWLIDLGLTQEALIDGTSGLYTTLGIPTINHIGTPKIFIAYASTQMVNVDGKPISFECYALKDANGSATNFIKLRDLALLLNGSPAQFQVGWDGGVTIKTKTAYTPNGSELSTPYSGNQPYQEATATTDVNGRPFNFSAFILTDNAGGGYTYYQLRELGQAIGFNVGWTANKGIFIETDKPYDASN